MKLKRTRELYAAQIARFGYDIGEYTYGTPAIWNHGGRNVLKIGRFCSIAENVQLILGGHHDPGRVTTSPVGLWFPAHRDAERGDKAPDELIIGNDVWIGLGSVIIAPCRIGDGAVIGSGAVVTKDVEPYAIVVGNPARELRKRFTESQIAELLQIRWWDWPHGRIEPLVPLLMGRDIDAFIEAARHS